ncbi:hypothetical protein DBY66_014255 [Pantoea sp. RIT413]|uniref:hypothetical protein n=1 Tax=Pantoea sp. RIT413 TaxID=2202162 RepID=UPI000D3B63E8|nr:hypothetical protein [Pantoea sp. RIT 413]RAU29960.1 hypothetical protein DBY66_014255 [Pantoea sp. RIT 413]
MLTALRSVLRLYEKKINNSQARIATLQSSVAAYQHSIAALEQDKALFELNLRALARSGSMNIETLREMRSIMGRVRRRIADISIRINDAQAEIMLLEKKLETARAERAALNKKKEKYLMRIADQSFKQRNAALSAADNETEEMSYGSTECGNRER